MAHEYRVGSVRRLGRRCSICGNPEVESIDAALRDGRSVRSVAEQWSISRSAVGRHLASGHGGLAELVDLDGAFPLLVGSVDARARALLDECEEAVRDAEAAGSSTALLRALKGHRASVRQEIKRHQPHTGTIEPVTPGQSAALEAAWRDAVRAYAHVRGRMLPRIEALAGLRDAIGPLLDVDRAKGAFAVNLVLALDDGTVLGRHSFLTSDPRFRDGHHVQLKLGQPGRPEPVDDEPMDEEPS